MTHILVITPSARPSLGGLETVLHVLGEGWARRGVSSTVMVTLNRPLGPESPDQYSFFRALWAARGADAIVFANASLRSLPIWLIFWRKSFLQHHSDYSQGLELGMRGRIARHIRLWWCRLARNISVSSWVADQLPGRHVVIGNPMETVEDTASVDVEPGLLVFAGRLVQEKGLDTLLRGLHRCKRDNLRLAVIGEGPQEASLRELTTELGLDAEVSWLGRLPRSQVLGWMRRSEAVVVPSTYEPFGMTAIEALAVGANLIVSDAGNLGDMFASVACVFSANDDCELAEVLDQGTEKTNETARRSILARRNSEVVSGRYLETMTSRAARD